MEKAKVYFIRDITPTAVNINPKSANILPIIISIDFASVRRFILFSLSYKVSPSYTEAVSAIRYSCFS